MSYRTFRFLVAAGASIWFACGGASAEIVRPAETDACRILSPRYEPKPERSPAAGEVRFLGGARVRSPVATPCPHSRRPVDA